jgi:hypothetical protein
LNENLFGFAAHRVASLTEALRHVKGGLSVFRDFFWR